MGYGLNDLPKITLIFLIVGIMFALSLVVLNSLRENAVGVTTVSVVNESFTMANNTAIQLSHTYLVAIQYVVNATAIIYPAVNYSILDSRAGTIKFVENLTTCKTGATCRVTYTYETFDETEASVALESSMDAVSEIPNNWLGLIAVIIAATIIIGIVIGALYSGVIGNFGGRR